MKFTILAYVPLLANAYFYSDYKKFVEKRDAVANGEQCTTFGEACPNTEAALGGDYEDLSCYTQTLASVDSLACLPEDFCGEKFVNEEYKSIKFVCEKTDLNAFSEFSFINLREYTNEVLNEANCNGDIGTEEACSHMDRNYEYDSLRCSQYTINRGGNPESKKYCMPSTYCG